MTDDEFARTPIAAASLTVLLLAQGPAAQIEHSVAEWVGCLREMSRAFEVIVVDALAQSPTEMPASGDPPVHYLTNRFPEVRVVHAPGNGLGALLRVGLAQAKEPLVVWTLANEEYQPSDLKKLLEAIDEVDLVIGVRAGRKIPWWLRLADFGYSWFCAILFGLPVEARVAWLGWPGLSHRLLARRLFAVGVHDPESTFCLARRELLARMEIQSDGSFAPVEFLAKANFFNALMAEVPVTFTGDPDQLPVEEPTFFQQAAVVFRQPDFGPAFLPPNTEDGMSALAALGANCLEAERQPSASAAEAGPGEPGAESR